MLWKGLMDIHIKTEENPNLNNIVYKIYDFM